jgi:plasmid stabilization system protein ParE
VASELGNGFRIAATGLSTRVIILFSKDAAADVSRLRSFLDQKSPIASAKAAAKLLAAIDTLQEFPGRGRPTIYGDLRELIVPFGRSAYVIRYKYRSEADEVLIMRVWHSREDRD